MTDVLLFQTPDNGDICIEGGDVELSPGLETAAYLSLFGGNLADDGSQNNPNNWWGNSLETDPSFEYRSQTQYLLGTIPPTTKNLLRLESAVKNDLKWLEDVSAANSVSVSASLIGLNKVQIAIDIKAEGLEAQFNFVENWRASA